MDTLKRKPRWNGAARGLLASGILTALLGLCLLWLPLGEGLVELSYDVPFWFRADVPVTQAAIVYLDSDSQQALGQPYLETWDRALYGELVDHLKRLGAQAVVFDMLFDLPSTNDARFVAAVRAFGKVALAAMSSPRYLGAGHTVIETKWPIEPLRAAAAVGMVEESKEEDFAIRRHYRSELLEPSLAWRVASLTMTNPPPERPARERWLNYYGPPLHLPNYSFCHVLSNQVPVSAISNKVVFVGARLRIGTTGGKGADDFPTPYSRWEHARSPGTEINATAYLNLVRGDWLTRLSPGTEAALCVLWGLAFGVALGACRPLTAAGFALFGALALFGTALWTTSHSHLWFAWLIPVVVQTPCALGLSVFGYTRRLLVEKQVLAATLAVTQSAQEAQARSSPAPTPAWVPSPLLHPGSASLSTFFNSPGAVPPATPGPAPSLPQAALAIPDHTLLRCIGRGAYGEVWLARDAIGTFHAVKIVHRASFTQPAPFEREFNGLKRFTPISRSHPGFVHVLHVGRNDELGYFYYIMEVGDDEVSGQKIEPERYSPKNLAKELKRRGRFSFPESVSLGITLAEALDYLHSQQLIHRDIKPSNIIFVQGRPKVADIGLVADIATGDKTMTVVGTPNYIPPEGPGTPAADVYSLGKVIYEASMGLDSSQFPDLPAFLLDGHGEPELYQLNNVIVRACDPDHQRRFQSARALLQALQELRPTT